MVCWRRTTSRCRRALYSQPAVAAVADRRTAAPGSIGMMFRHPESSCRSRSDLRFHFTHCKAPVTAPTVDGKISEMLPADKVNSPRTVPPRPGRRRRTSSRRRTSHRGACFDQGVAGHPGTRHAIGVTDRDRAPSTLSLSLSMPSLSRQYSTCTANASFSSPQADVIDLQAVALQQLGIANTGPMPISSGSVPADAMPR